MFGGHSGSCVLVLMCCASPVPLLGLRLLEPLTMADGEHRLATLGAQTCSPLLKVCTNEAEAAATRSSKTG